MKHLRLWARLLGWASLGVLIGLGFWQGTAPFQSGGWFWSLAAGVLLAVLMRPKWIAQSLPAAAMATFVGGLLFSFLPQMQGQETALALFIGAGGAAVLSALLCLGARGAVGMAMLGGILHIGLIEVLTAPAMTSPFALWPWSVAVLLAVWLGVGLGIRAMAPRAT